MDASASPRTTARRRVASRACGAAALVALGALLVWGRARWPDDWDGVGFLLSVRTFSLARFMPHPPGYPVYVAALRIAAALGASPLGASAWVGVTSGLGAAWLAYRASRRAGVRVSEAPWVAAAVVGSPLALRAFTVVGTEGLALTLLALALAALPIRGHQSRATPARSALLGLALGLGLGVRLSWGPLYLGLLVVGLARGRRGPLLVAFAAAVAAWAVPLLVLTGPHELVRLFATHLGGHATRWGGTALTEPSRARYLARDVLVDGLGIEADPLGVTLATTVTLLALRGAVLWWRRGGAVTGPVRALGAYLLWIGVGQNLREEPRHALPIVAAIAFGLVVAGLAEARERARTARFGALLAVAFVALTSLRGVRDVAARRACPPAAAELVALFGEDPNTLVFGARSARFFELDAATARRARAAATLGDVVLDLGRERHLPARVLVTDELEGRGSAPYPLVPVTRLCRPERLDRRRPCLEVDELRAPFLARARR